MSRVRFSRLAKADLEDIWVYSVAQWGTAKADAYVRRINSAVDRVAANISLSRPCDDIRAGYRKYRIGSHVLYIRNSVEGLEVVRILHMRMDPGRHV